jgi:hypothetical protein
LSLPQRLNLGWKALRELGFKSVGLYALYEIGLWTGHFKRSIKDENQSPGVDLSSFVLRSFLPLPSRQELVSVIGKQGLEQLLGEADEIVSGKVRLFGEMPVELELLPPRPLVHWTSYEHPRKRRLGVSETEPDIRIVWEHGRFGWAYVLARAYHLTGDERYSEAFWEFTSRFLSANPPYSGAHWVSAQEAALRLIALVFTWHIFRQSPNTTPERNTLLGRAIAAHARRIPPTMVYARAQNNNHLLSEAAGLVTAAIALPEHSQSKRWQQLGWDWFNRGLKEQVADDGAYIQHSTNYHRLMLQLALWMNLLAHVQKRSLPPSTVEPLKAATRWLLAMTDLNSGRVPNLGPNDGSYVQPLTTLPLQDYRPVLQAASRAFLGQNAFPPNGGDELSFWMNVGDIGVPPSAEKSIPTIKEIIHSPQGDSWAYLRAAHFKSRPGHADQLHLDLWWRGVDLTQDAGTYLYNALPPWDNSLGSARVHNTLVVNETDQMTHAGRFLWLDWAQAQVVELKHAEDGSWVSLAAQHNGYRRFGISHRRTATAHRGGSWVILDDLLAVGRVRHDLVKIELNWLLPDWSWKVDECKGSSFEISIKSVHGWITLRVKIKNNHQVSNLISHPTLNIIRAGVLEYGVGEVSSVWGWTSPTYGHKEPALSIRIKDQGILPLSMISEWQFPQSSSSD